LCRKPLIYRAKKMTRKKPIWFGLLIIFFIINFCSMAAAGEISVEPMLMVSGGYDDNIDFKADLFKEGGIRIIF